MRRTIAFAIVLTMLLLLCGCAAAPVSGMDNITGDFLTAFCEQRFEDVYDYFWPHTMALSRENFVADAKSVIQAMGVTGISVRDDMITEQNGGEMLSYTLVYETAANGQIENAVQLRIIRDEGYYLNYSPEMFLSGYENGDRLTMVTVPGRRGEIFTADGVCIAANTYADSVYIRVRKDQNVGSIISRLTDILGLSEVEAQRVKKQYDSALANNYGTVLVKALRHGATEGELAERLLAIEDVGIDTTSMTVQRHYPYGPIYCHITGYTGAPNEEELAALKGAGLESATQVGKEGLEKTYDLTLQGRDGYRLQLSTADGQYKATVAQKAAQDGSDLILSIDSDLQQRAYYQLASEIDARQTGAAVVMDGSNSFVQALVNWPCYDPNLFIGGISAEDYAALTDENGRLPLFSRATMGLYPPGSLFKPFTIVPALEAGVVNANTVFPYTIKNNQWQPGDSAWVWPPITRNEEADGPLNLAMAMKKSDNIYFGWVALLLGEEKFMAYMEKMGVGEKLPFDLATAKSNLLNQNTEMNRKLLTDMSFGQGEVLITPIQMVTLYTAYVNGGDAYAPQLVREIRAAENGDYKTVETREPQVYKAGLISQKSIDTIMPTLEEVVESGTARALRISGRKLAAKTGTALKGGEKTEKISWIISWWRQTEAEEDPRIVMVVVDSPRELSDSKLQIARSLLVK